MSSGNLTPGGLTPADIHPTTISPSSLLISSSSLLPSSVPSLSNTSPIPSLPLASSAAAVTSSPSSVISRPPKQHIRPRATTDKEKQDRLEDRKLANRTAAKLSRQRQKQAMEEALRENERLKQENAELVNRLTSLEKRMEEMESQQRQQLLGESSTHQPARPMSATELQCPIPLLPKSTSIQTRIPQHYSNIHFYSRSTRTRILIYALQMLMHSFVLSMTMPMLFNHSNQFLTTSMTLPISHSARSVTQRRIRISSQWMRVRHGYATPNRNDLSGAFRNALGLRRRIKSSVQTGKDSLRMVGRHGRRDKGKYFRLIIKKI